MAVGQKYSQLGCRWVFFCFVLNFVSFLYIRAEQFQRKLLFHYVETIANAIDETIFCDHNGTENGYLMQLTNKNKNKNLFVC